MACLGQGHGLCQIADEVQLCSGKGSNEKQPYMYTHMLSIGFVPLAHCLLPLRSGDCHAAQEGVGREGVGADPRLPAKESERGRTIGNQ